MVRKACFLVVCLETIGAAPVPPDKSGVTEIFKQAASTRQFSGARVSEVLLAEPEATQQAFRYLTEFTVTKSGKSIRCEDWAFSLVHENGHWIVTDIKRGRCND